MSPSLITFNVALDTYSALICSLIILSLFIRKVQTKKTEIWFGITCACCMGMSISDIFTWISEGTDKAWKLISLPVSEFVYYVFGCLIFVCYVRYVIEVLSIKARISKWNWYTCVIIFIVYLTGIIITPFTDFYYTITPENHYIRGKYFWIITVVDVFFYFQTLILILSKKKSIKRHQFISLLTFIIFPMITQTIQILFYGIALNCTGISLSFLVIFINLQQRLEDSLRESHNAIKQRDDTIIQMQDNTIVSLSNLVENRDAETGHHVTRTREYVKIISNQCQIDGVFSEIIDDIFVTLMYKAAPMHDIGKIIIPDSVLKKPGKLTEEEFKLIQKHAVEGGRIINEVLGIAVDSEYLKIAAQIAIYHHEKWDGTGYPENLKGEDIPICARIMAIADVFDALISKRCYKDAMPFDDAFELIKSESGSHFDPILVKEFVKAKDKIKSIVDKFND